MELFPFISAMDSKDGHTYFYVLFQEYIKAAHMKERQRLIKKTEDEKVCLVSNF